MEVILKDNWNFILRKKDDYYILNVVFSNNMADYSRSFKFLENEVEIEMEALKKVVEKIRKNPDTYKSIEVIPAI